MCYNINTCTEWKSIAALGADIAYKVLSLHQCKNIGEKNSKIHEITQDCQKFTSKYHDNIAALLSMEGDLK